MTRCRKDIKVCFAASSGGHLEQLLALKPLMERYDSFILTEKTAYDAKLPVRVRYVRQVNRHEINFLPRMAVNAVTSLRYWFTEHPDVIVCTGVLATIPFCLIGHAMGAKLVYVESFAKTDSPTMTWGPGNRILKNYLSFSFSRAVFLTERDVDQTAPSNLPLVFGDDRCLFNTGLYTRRFETIYGLFEPNTKPDARQRWFLKGFFKESDPMLVSFEYLPCRVRFAEDPSELVFDYRLPIRSNIDHILGDEENLTRIPASLMGEGNSLLLRRAFEGAVVEAARRAAANYTLAVPQFYGGRIQLLLPLCLTGDKPELALTIQREDGFYAARTCLTLDMAYNNARLICRPETSWIKR